VTIKIEVSQQAQAMLDEADERWCSAHSFEADNPLLDEVARAAELLRDNPEIVSVTARTRFGWTYVACFSGQAGTSTIPTTPSRISHHRRRMVRESWRETAAMN
jgi:hypothetical protein